MSTSSYRRPACNAVVANNNSSAFANGDDEEDEVFALQQPLSDESDSGDEWRPTSATKGKKRTRTATIISDDDEDAQDEPSATKRGKTNSQATNTTSNRQKQSRRRTHEVEDDEEMAELTRFERKPEEEEERGEAADEAKQLWKAVRTRRQEAASGDTAHALPPAPKEPPSIVTAIARVSGSSQGADQSSVVRLTSGLGASPSHEPTVSDAAVVSDRDSLFVGFVFELRSSVDRHKLINHLTRVIHPRIPAALLPSGLRLVQPNKRGATHNILAWRVLALKPGRDGSEGPEAYGTQEGEDDDGEKSGAKPITRVIKLLGASDVLVVVSRYFGGTMLGPVRFQHIETCAREALKQHMLNENLAILRQQLNDLNESIAKVRVQITPGSSSTAPVVHPDTDSDKLQRLVLARQKQLAMLEKKLLQSNSATTSGGRAVRPKQQAHRNREDLDAAQRALAVLPP